MKRLFGSLRSEDNKRKSSSVKKTRKLESEKPRDLLRRKRFAEQKKRQRLQWSPSFASTLLKMRRRNTFVAKSKSSLGCWKSIWPSNRSSKLRSKDKDKS